MAAGEGIAAIIKSLDDLADGWWLPHKAKRAAKADISYSELYIEHMREQGIELSENQAKAFMLMNSRGIKNAENLGAILDKMQIPENAPADRIEDEWYSAWIDGAKDAFSEWNRDLYRSAMEHKAFDPTSVSRAALGIIAKMDKGDLLAIQKLMGLCALDECHYHNPMILSEEDEILRLAGLTRSIVGHLQDIGVLRQTPDSITKQGVWNKTSTKIDVDQVYFIQERLERLVDFSFFGHEKVRIPVPCRTTNNGIRKTIKVFVDYGHFVFTESGLEICNMLEPTKCESIEDYLRAANKAILENEQKLASRNSISSREFDRAVSESIKRARR